MTLVRGDERLAGYKIPRQFTFTDQVPRSAAGKIQRWRLAPYHENGATPPWILPSTR